MPRRMDRRMRRMMKDIKVDEIDATEVIIRTPEKEIVILDPNVTLTKMQGIDVYQVMGGVKKVRTPSSLNSQEEEKSDFDASLLKDSDIELVAKQGKASLEEARDALIKSQGDLAAAVLLLRSKKREK